MISTITIGTKNGETFSDVSNTFLDYYMSSASGEFVKIYLYTLRQLKAKNNVTVNEIAKALGMTMGDILRGFAFWSKKGLIAFQKDEDGNIINFEFVQETVSKRNPDIGEKTSVSEPNNTLELKEVKETLFFENQQQSLTRPIAYEKINVQAQLERLKEINDKDRIEVPPTRGALPVNKNNAKPPKIDKKTYPPTQVSRVVENNDEFKMLKYFVETIANRNLSASYLSDLLDFYEDMKLPVEVIEYIYEYAVTNNKFNVRFIYALGLKMYEHNIQTREQAKGFMPMYNATFNAISKVLNLGGKPPTPKQQDFIDKWIGEYMFSDDIIICAFNRAKDNGITNVNFKYVDTILDNWHKAGVRTIKDIEKADQEYKEKKKTSKKINNTYYKKNSFTDFTQATTEDFYKAYDENLGYKNEAVPSLQEIMELEESIRARKENDMRGVG